MNRRARRDLAADTRAHVRTFTEELAQVPREEWPPSPVGHTLPAEVWRSRRYLVMVYGAPAGQERISVQRTDRQDGIGWDDLQGIKSAIGRGHVPAVELYPPDQHVVAVARMRHLWTLPELPAWAWRCD